MGRRGNNGKQKRTQARDFKQQRDNVWRPNSRNNNWQDLDMTNAAFEEYYKAQAIVPEGEWEAFMASLRTTLPTTFRINGSGKFAEELRIRLETDFLASFSAGPIKVAGEELQPPRPLPWYPRKLAWQMDASRTQLRKLDALTAVHDFMKRENEAGGITRQEAVSMVPPLFLDVQPHHKVLDMCAAPGSKTFQLLEALHAVSTQPAGLVVANDADAQRCNLLTHQVKRMCSPALIVSNHEAQHFPLIHSATKDGAPHLFDRILCDVPCSGDGTIRKAPDIWRKWSVGNGNGLHPLQLRITLRACALLQVGGRLVYSTCTFNPVEDEAVVTEVLRRTGGAMELVEVSEQLPALKRVPGLATWKVRDRENFYSTWEEAKAANAQKVDPTMFPDAASAELPLERCMRVLPHHGDTGGFFIAVLRKVGPIASIAPVTLAHRNVQQQPQPASISAAIPGAPAAGAEDLSTAASAIEPPAADVAAAPTAAEGEATVPVPAADAAGSAAAADAAATPAATDAAGADAAASAACAAVDPAAVGDAQLAEATAAAAEPAASAPAPAKSGWGTRGGGSRGREGSGRWGGLDPVVPVTSPDLLNSVAAFYGLGDGSSLAGQLVTRNAEREKPKRLYFVGSGVSQLLEADEREQLKVTATGVKAFERQEIKDGSVPCSYRIAQEGLPLLLPSITRQRIDLNAAEFLRLLTERSMPIPREPDAAEPAAASGPAAAAPAAAETAAAPMDASAAAGLAVAPAADAAATQGAATSAAEVAAGDVVPASGGDAAAVAEATEPVKKVGGPTSEKPRGPPLEDPSTLKQLRSIGNGCCIATLRNNEAEAMGLPSGNQAEGALSAAAPLALSCWRGRASLNILVAKPECAQLAEKLRSAAARRQAAKPQTPLNPHAPEFKPCGAPAAAAPALPDVSAAAQADGSGPMEGVTIAVNNDQPPEAAAAAVALVGNKRTVDARSPPPKEPVGTAAKKPSLS